MTNILGFNAYIHDAAAALVSGGRLVAFGEEERFNRIKHTTEFPASSIEFVLRQAGLTSSDLDAVAFYWDPYCGLGRRAAQTIARFPGSLRQLFRMQAGNFARMRGVESVFRERYPFEGAFHHVNHYLAHAAGAFYPSPFDDAMILIIDGNGEIATTWLGRGEGNAITPLGEIFYPHSLGLLYCTVTEYLGYRQNCDEGKVMGLSAYGSDRFLGRFRQIVRVSDNGLFRLDLSYFDYHKSRKNWFSPKFAAEFGPPRRPGEPIADHHKDVAYACQTLLEESVMKMTAALVKRTGKRRLAFSGGVALNCVLNGKLLDSGLIDDLYVPPPAYDAGSAWGAALHVFHQMNPNAPRQQTPSPFLGPEYADQEMKSALDCAGIAYEKPSDIAAAVARFLARGFIVGCFDGRMEMGPRALGHRSILADPRPVDMKDRLNERVKHREAYRPFGPSVPAELAHQVFETGGFASPYMLAAFRVREEWAGRIPAVTHADGTARIQTVEQADDPRYHEIIKAFFDLSGTPCVLNTSFNVMGQPIVNTPKEAVECYLSTGIDVLALGPFVASKVG